MSRNTFFWCCSLAIAAAYLGFGLPLIAQIGMGEFTAWGMTIGLVLGLSPLFGLWASNSPTFQVRAGVSIVLGVLNILSAVIVIFGVVGVLSYSLPKGLSEIFGIAMVLISLCAFTMNTIMFVKVMRNSPITERELA